MQDLFGNLRVTSHRFRGSEGLPTTLEINVADEKSFSRFSMLGGIKIGDTLFVNPHYGGGESLSSPHQKCEDIIKKTNGSVLVFTSEGNLPSFFVRPGLAAGKNLEPTLQQIYSILLARVKKPEEGQGEVLPERRLTDYYKEVDVGYLGRFYLQIMQQTPEFRRDMLRNIPSSPEDFISDYHLRIIKGMVLDPPKNSISAMMLGRILAHVVDRDTLKEYGRKSPHSANYISIQHQFFKSRSAMMDRIFSKLCEDIGLEQALKS